MTRMIIATIGMLLSYNSAAFCQLDDALFRRSQEVLYESINGKGELRSPIQRMISRCQLLPVEQSKEFLLRCLEAEEQHLQIHAADILIKKSGMQFKESVVPVLNNLKTDKSEIVIKKTLLLAKLGDLDAVKQFDLWGQQILEKKPLQIPGIESHEWICPMVCANPSKQHGRCEICGMELVHNPKGPVSKDWHSKVAVIRSLFFLGKQIDDHARLILASDADSFSRMQVAELWTIEDRSAGLSHLKLFLHSDYRDFVFGILADVAPQESANEFATVLLSQPESSFVRFDAWRGQIRAGKLDVLGEVRKIADANAKSDNEMAQKAHAVALLAEFATGEDVERLTTILEGRYALIAAENLLKRRLQKNVRYKAIR